MPTRLTYPESCQILQTNHLLDEGDTPTLLERPPRHDDEVLGVSFFRTVLADCTLENLTLPRTFFGRSEIRSVSFRGSDLSESVACWNDFTDVDFSLVDLSQADLRASIFKNVNFYGANLHNVDFRHATFQKCIFTNADLAGAKFVRGFRWFFILTSSQRSSVNWQKTPGEEPKGG
jgi:BTB/POZ domain-containing protein KCTD9